MNVDDLLRFLAPLTPAVLPVIVFVWFRTRQELHGIREELVELRQRSSQPDPRLDDLIEAVHAIGAEVGRLAAAERATLRELAERATAPPFLERRSPPVPQ